MSYNFIHIQIYLSTFPKHVRHLLNSGQTWPTIELMGMFSDFIYFRMFLKVYAYECMYLNTISRNVSEQNIMLRNRGGGASISGSLYIVCLSVSSLQICPNTNRTFDPKSALIVH